MTDDLLDQINQVGWFLPFVALLIPFSVIGFFSLAKMVSLMWLAAQIAAIYFGLRSIAFHLRHTGFDSFQVKIMLGPFYMVACFATNLVSLLGFGVFLKFF